MTWSPLKNSEKVQKGEGWGGLSKLLPIKIWILPLEENTAGTFLLQFPWRDNDGFNLRELGRLHQPPLYSYLGLHLTFMILLRFLSLGVVIISLSFRLLSFDLVKSTWLDSVNNIGGKLAELPLLSKWIFKLCRVCWVCWVLKQQIIRPLGSEWSVEVIDTNYNIIVITEL